MVKLGDVLDEGELQRMLDQRFVKAVRDETTGCVLYNYTARAQYENEWNPVTSACRGLIVNARGELIARPFAKFHNYSADAVAGLAGRVVATEKLDGSLGILYRAGGELRIATRGSFDSDQALHATAVLKQRHAGFEPVEGWTYLFEIVYPQNRIVVDYGVRDELVLLGAIDIESGVSVPLEQAAEGWDGAVVEVLEHTTLEEALGAEPRPNAEGMVVHFVDHDVRVKLKQDEYVRLHRLVTGVSERRIWEELAAGRDVHEWLEMVPDELHRFVTETSERLRGAHNELRAELEAELARIKAELRDGWTRREFAEMVRASRHPLARGLFAMEDGKDVSALLWEPLRPAEHIPFFNAGLD